MARRKGGRRFATTKKSKLIFKIPDRRLLAFFAFFILLVLLFNMKGIWAFFTDTKHEDNYFTIITSYDITFEPNGGIGNTETQTLSFNEDTPLRENTFTNTGYSFIGWNTEADGSGTNFDDMELVNQDSFDDFQNIVLYAQWGNGVAKIGNNYYNTLQEAINAVPNDNTLTKVELLKDTQEALIVDADKNIKFDFKNHTITNKGSTNVIVNNGRIEISNGHIVSTASQGAINNNSGATLIMTGGLFFAGIATFVFIAFGCLSVVTGILKSFVGSTANAFNASREMDAEQTDKYIKENVSKVSEKVKPLVMSHQIIMSAVFIFAMTVGIVLSLSLTAPYFVFAGIMISGLSLLGLLNSIFHVFGKGTPAQVKLHRYGKFLECTAFVLGGLSLILFGILPVSTAFAGLIGISSIALKFLLIAFGATSIFKSIKQYSRMSSNIKYLLAKQELKFTGLKMDKLKKWKKDLYDNTYNPKFDFADITLKNMEVCFDKKPVVQNNNQWITFFF